jgi:hypothetical protein
MFHEVEAHQSEGALREFASQNDGMVGILRAHRYNRWYSAA